MIGRKICASLAAGLMDLFASTIRWINRFIFDDSLNFGATLNDLCFFLAPLERSPCRTLPRNKRIRPAAHAIQKFPQTKQLRPAILPCHTWNSKILTKTTTAGYWPATPMTHEIGRAHV